MRQVNYNLSLEAYLNFRYDFFWIEDTLKYLIMKTIETTLSEKVIEKVWHQSKTTPIYLDFDADSELILKNDIQKKLVFYEFLVTRKLDKNVPFKSYQHLLH